MIKLLEDLLIEATCSPNVPGSLVAGPRKAVDEARAAIPSPTSAPVELPPPFDSLEEAQRAAGMWPQEAEPATVRVANPNRSHFVRLVEGDGYRVGQVVVGDDGMNAYPAWAPCDKDGWVDLGVAVGVQVPHIEFRQPGNQWRPLPAKPSAIDEMAEQMKRWAAPTREDTPEDLEIQLKVHEDRWSHLPESVMSEEDIAAYRKRGDSKPTNPKDAAATDRVPLGLLSPIAKAHWALAQHCGRAKYGAWNWREAGVRASIYIDAIGRHIDGYLSGETYDPADGTHHLGNIMACCAILLEAEAAGKLVDDRPPTLDMRPTYAEVQRRLADLTNKYADRNPKHWTR